MSVFDINGVKLPPWFSSGHGEAESGKTRSPGSTLGNCIADTTICEDEEGVPTMLVKAARMTNRPSCLVCVSNTRP